jgi:hypothetical protein
MFDGDSFDLKAAPLAALQRCLEASGSFASVVSPETDTPGVLWAVHAFMQARLADTSAPA